MNANALETTAKALVAECKGILAADESTGSIEKRFASINLPSTEENPPRLPGNADYRPGDIRLHQRGDHV